MQIRVRTDKGSINGQGTTVTIPVDTEGKISFTLSAGGSAETATITASSIQGDATGNITVNFVQ